MRQFVAVGLMVGSVAWAQQSTARLLGTVKDPTGAVVGSATATAQNIATGQDRKTATDETGD